MKLLRTLFLFACGLVLVALAGYPLEHSELALPAALAGVSSFALALS